MVNLHVSASAGRPPWTDVTITAPITLRTAKVSGTVYGDQNNNNRMDPGEGMAGGHGALVVCA
ncbi:hypothetical protein [Actinocrispum sp. NPDC049592]|uniref:hypothetical protein n=1 Tax=Actinocrispum sp. NPDC049592 TaxID=3154835 RepID=UPI00341DBE0C